MKHLVLKAKKSPGSTKSSSRATKAATASRRGATSTSNLPEYRVIAYSFNRAGELLANKERDQLNSLKQIQELPLKPGGICVVRPGFIFIHVGLERNEPDFLVPSERFRRLGAILQNKLAVERISQAVIDLDSFLLEGTGLFTSSSEAAQFLAEGLGLASYRFDRDALKESLRRTKPFTEKAPRLTHGSPAQDFFPKAISFESKTESAERIDDALLEAEYVIEGSSLCRDLSNAPPNALLPHHFASRAKEVVQKNKSLGLSITVFDEKQIVREGMGLLIGVGQGSANPPRFIVVEYNPKQNSKAKGKSKTKGNSLKTLALVGKGMTFDSGGISIKPSPKMEDMKHDMSGAAACLGAVLTIARLQLPLRILCVLAVAENMPDGNAICPGHVLKSRNGKTVEVNNTDAEGRLILADALDWTQDQKPDYIVNMATLTGAIGIALGKLNAGVMVNHPELRGLLNDAARASGERIWELPSHAEYFDDLRSEYADMRNVGDGPSGGAIRAGMFLKQFIREGVQWGHIDMASTGFDHGMTPYSPRKGSSGWGVRLFLELARSIAGMKAK